jgi:hypothetical protein
MKKIDVYRELAARGVARAVVLFSGGGDEGGADAILLFDEAGSRLPYLPYTDYEDDSPDAALRRELEEPVYDRFGTFAGDFYVAGRVEWLVSSRRVVVRCDDRGSLAGET